MRVCDSKEGKERGGGGGMLWPPPGGCLVKRIDLTCFLEKSTKCVPRLACFKSVWKGRIGCDVCDILGGVRGGVA